MMIIVDPHLLTPIEAASLLSVKPSTIYAWVHRRLIPFRKHGRLLRFDRETLIKWSKNTETQPILRSR
ncbi:MAG: helix-turn-helix domain-containing protein [Oligoflexales bacterium]|nr:helix-turn-helix domain-containing protein [Oligoflexales bacterium]